MGYSACYQAISEKSDIFNQIISSKLSMMIIQGLFNFGIRPFDIYGSDQKSVLNEIIAQIVREELTNESPDLVYTVMEDLRLNLTHAERLSPCLFDRTSYLYNSIDIIKETLVVALAQIGFEHPEEFIDVLIFGERDLIPNFTMNSRSYFSIVGQNFVSRGADVLRNFTASSIFSGDEETQNDYCKWREMYLRAADKRESIIVFGY